MTRPLGSYVICTLPRSGSYLLCDLLSQTDYLGYPAEYYDDANRSYYNRLIGTEKARDYNIVFDYAMRIGTTPNGMFGAKVLWHQLHHLKQAFLRCGSYADWQPTDIIHRLLPAPRYIHLIRRDKLRQAISYCRAMDTGIWFSFADSTPATPGRRAEYDATRIAYWLSTMQAWEQAWEREFARIGATVLTLYYEDFVADPIGTVVQVHNFLDMPISVILERLRPQLARQSGAESEAWARRYLQEHAAQQVPVPA
jgi:LPS sulfotransferase NodH